MERDETGGGKKGFETVYERNWLEETLPKKIEEGSESKGRIETSVKKRTRGSQGEVCRGMKKMAVITKKKNSYMRERRGKKEMHDDNNQRKERKGGYGPGFQEKKLENRVGGR